jgi:hypothetical protein
VELAQGLFIGAPEPITLLTARGSADYGSADRGYTHAAAGEPGDAMPLAAQRYRLPARGRPRAGQAPAPSVVHFSYTLIGGVACNPDCGCALQRVPMTAVFHSRTQ